MWVQIVVMIVALIVSYVMRPKPTVPKPAALEDFNVPTAEDGRECSMVFGTNWIDDPNVLFYGICAPHRSRSRVARNEVPDQAGPPALLVRAPDLLRMPP